MRAIVAFICLLLLPSLAFAQATRALQSVGIVALEGNRVQLVLTLSSPPPQPTVFAIDNPARLSLDLPDTRVAVAQRFSKINVGKARSVSVVEAQGRARVVVELTAMATYRVSVDGNRVFLVIESGAAVAAPSPASPAPRMAAAQPAAAFVAPASLPASSAQPAATSISNIDFRRGDKGEGRVLVTLGDAQSVVDVVEEGGRIIARLKNASVPEKLLRRLDVLDFATPVKFIDTIRDGNGAKIIITPVTQGDFERSAFQAGNLFTLELQPLTSDKLDDRRKQEPQFKGERISLSFQSVDIRALLQIIAEVAGSNMVVSDTVSGQLAMRLQNVPWDQALDIILRTKGLGLRQQGNVMLVAPLTELAAREKAELETEKQKTDLAPLRSELIQINYAKAADLAALLKSGDSSFVSERGRVSIDERTNTLLVLETRDKLGDIRNLVARLDIPVKQVLIESRIVIANNDYSKELGARFGVSAVKRNGNNGLVSTSGSAAANETATQSFIANGFPVQLGAQNNRFNVNLPAASNAGRIALAVLGADYLIDLELSALQAEGRGEVISSPRVITANAKQASIEQGVEIPYQEASSSGATSVSFKKAVLALNVTPQITPDNRIIMDLSVNKDSVGQQVANTLGGTIPSIDTRKLTTQVLVENGQTVVLGGIYEQENRNTINKVPFLGDIPVLGAAFRSRITVANKDELLIFVTPKILQDGLRTD